MNSLRLWVWTFRVKHLQVRSFAVRDAAALHAAFPTLESADFLQHRQAPDRPAGAVAVTAVVVVTAGENAIGAGGTLDLVQGVLQAGQRVLAVFVRVSVAPGSGRRRRGVAELTRTRGQDGSGRSQKLRRRR